MELDKSIGTLTQLATCGALLLVFCHVARVEAATVVSTDGVPIAYEVAGAGALALVFVHGWSCDRSYWQGQLEQFAERFRVVAVDLGGHGESGTGREAWTIASFGGDVAAVVEELGIEEAILIGHSMGGDAIVEAARRLPGRVLGLVWVDTYRSLGNVRSAAEIEELVSPYRARFEETTRNVVRGMFPAGAAASLVERVVSDMSAAPPEVAVPAIESALRYGNEVTAILESLDVPVVAVNPEEPATDLESMQRYGVEVLLVPGAGHFPMLEKPELFNRRLAEVIDMLSGPVEAVEPSG